MSAITKALAELLLDGIEAIGRRLRASRSAPDPARPRPEWTRGHNWQRGVTPVICVWCRRELTESNEYSPCPGP